MDLYANLEQIISTKNEAPIITNEQSNFVVITYWWGRGNQNANLARPCASFYEFFIGKITSKAADLLMTAHKKMNEQYPQLFKVFLNSLHMANFSNIVNKYTNMYVDELMTFLNLDPHCNVGSRDAVIIDKLTKPDNGLDTAFKFISIEHVKNVLSYVAIEYVRRNLQNFLNILNLKTQKDQLNADYLTKMEGYKTELSAINLELNTLKPAALEEFKSQHSEIASSSELLKLFDAQLSDGPIKELTLKRDALKSRIANFQSSIKNTINPIKKQYDDAILAMKQMMGKVPEPMSVIDNPIVLEGVEGKSLNQILVQHLRYKPSQTYEAMIEFWKQSCAAMNCNCLAVEYPEFAKPGGYQLAINAKPMFIQKALELCSPRGVLYIDGDMYLRKYPRIFDTLNVDYMARGWNMDPRASEKFVEESILYDPYTFETSGGTMFFGQTLEAKRLLQMWINETKKPVNKGKADDRIISLLFNSKKLLCEMKIIQLPIEYLWLTLDYDWLHMDVGNYGSLAELHETIMIEHPECLTSEETAAGSGAASSREPKLYSKFIEEIRVPVSEEMYEYIFFETPEMVDEFKHYLKYMKNAYYFTDPGNVILYEKKLVPENSTSMYDNEQPLYIYNYDKKFNKRNDVHEANMAAANAINIAGLPKDPLGYTIIQSDVYDKQLIPTILKCIADGVPCLVLPANSAEAAFKENYNVYSHLELVYSPLEIYNYSFEYNTFYRLGFDLSQPMFFNTKENSVLHKYLSMFALIEDFGEYIMNGAYHLVSLTRMGYIKNKRTPAQRPVQPVKRRRDDDEINDGKRQKVYAENNLETVEMTGGGSNVEEMQQQFDEYLLGLQEMYLDAKPIPTPAVEPQSNLEPTLESQQPTLESQQPTLESQQPTLESQQHTLESQQPTLESQQPTLESQQPTLKSQQPTLESQQPTLEPVPQLFPPPPVGGKKKRTTRRRRHKKQTKYYR